VLATLIAHPPWAHISIFFKRRLQACSLRLEDDITLKEANKRTSEVPRNPRISS
jgi:hypothetical protein